MNTAVSAAYSLLILLVFWENFLRVSMVVIKKIISTEYWNNRFAKK